MSESVDGRRIRAVVADDHASFRRALSRMLRLDPEIEVVGEACDGKEARDLCLALRPDVALLDFMMPELKGPDVIRSIKPSLPTTALVVLSVYGQEVFRREATESGADAYLIKGMPAEELLQTVKSAVATRRAQFEGSGGPEDGPATAFVGGRNTRRREGR